jgi:uncharacterized membrane protein YqaE (UPF0057 family)
MWGALCKTILLSRIIICYSACALLIFSLLKLMDTSNEGQPCESNKDCSSNLCKMIYRDGQPLGRRCLIGSGSRFTKNCQFSKDCQSGRCERIYDNAGRFVARKCVKAKKINRDNGSYRILGKTSSYEKNGKYGVLNDHEIALVMGQAGPVTGAISKVISIVFDLFTLIVYNFRAKSYDHENQGIMYGLFASIAFGIMEGITGFITGGLISGPTTVKHLKEGKCDVETSRPIDMWFIRIIITILFPPLGVLMAKGFTGFSYILTSCALTALFYFPGLIYSLAIISTSRFARLETAERNKGKQDANKNNLN